ncbi:hypothetical protein [Gimesia maris]|uniref:hypothetical protein n=1 Tax=Gimesia maris TaxID=122 RepID=UPI0032EE4B26
MKTTFTTEEAAKALKVSTRQVQRWFDSGLLKNYVLPGTIKHITSLDNLTEFLEKQNLPIPEELEDGIIVGITMKCGTNARVRMHPDSGCMDMIWQYSINSGDWIDSPCRRGDLERWLRMVTAEESIRIN